MIKRLIKAWKSETPKVWKIVRNLAAAIMVTWTGFISGSGMVVPKWGWAILVVSSIIVAYSGTRQKKQ